jgi:dTDP-4-dehydrorhamnose 3,5-epimerase
VKFTPLALPEVILVEPDVHRDARGFFVETYHLEKYRTGGIPGPFVQDNHSRSVQGTLRGLHAQRRRPQGKLVRAVDGEMFDVAVDIRRGSPTFGRWAGLVLSADEWNQLFVPKGFAHGFVTLEEDCEVLYKVSAPFAPELDRAIRFDDPDIGIEWPLSPAALTLSDKDRQAPRLGDAETF